MSFAFLKFCPLGMVWCVILAFFSHASAQVSSREAPLSLAPTMQQLTRQSGLIFAGTVLKVAHSPAAQTGELATVRTTFHVEQAIRGVRAGQVVEIREWAGLWDSGEQYRAGERVLLLLYPRSKLGLTSPVGGSLGRFSVNSDGEVILRSAQHLALSSSFRSAGVGRETSRVSARDLLRAIQHEAAE